MFDDNDFWDNLADELEDDLNPYDLNPFEDFSGEIEDDRPTRNWNDGFEQGLIDFTQNFKCKWIGGSEYADAYVMGFTYGENGGV